MKQSVNKSDWQKSFFKENISYRKIESSALNSFKSFLPLRIESVSKIKLIDAQTVGEIQKILKNLDYIHIAMDDWSDNRMKRFIGIIYCYVRSHEVRTFALEFLYLELIHKSPEILQELFKQTLIKYRVQNCY